MKHSHKPQQTPKTRLLIQNISDHDSIYHDSTLLHFYSLGNIPRSSSLPVVPGSSSLVWAPGSRAPWSSRARRASSRGLLLQSGVPRRAYTIWRWALSASCRGRSSPPLECSAVREDEEVAHGSPVHPGRGAARGDGGGTCPVRGSRRILARDARDEIDVHVLDGTMDLRKLAVFKIKTDKYLVFFCEM